MNYKILVSFAVLCIASSCYGDNDTSVEESAQVTSNETLESDSNESSDLSEGASVWQLWRPFRNWGLSAFNKKFTHSPFWKESDHGGRHNMHRDRPKLKNKIKFLFKVKQFVNKMYYVDSQRTLTRRDSSLITPKKSGRADDFDVSSLCQGQMSVPLNSESSLSVVTRPRGSVQKELVTLMFESMLCSIVTSWELIPPKQDSLTNVDVGKVGSETYSVTGTSRRKKPVVKSSRSRPVASRSKLGSVDTQDSQVSWWSGPDERAIVRFRNGNLYEGNISMKCMHGEGRFQWADGTVYLGQFKENEIVGKGMIQWKDDTWYQGEFAGNLRHGQGLYVNSRLQSSYAGGWYCGTKHGQGVIYYSKDFKNSYDGNWIHNERFGYGSREYCALSGFKGEWERNIREGKGFMIWPNSDCYRGEWRNGVMSGNGIYIWDSYYNNSMSLPSLKAYRGRWEKGRRHGYGLLNLGLGLGSFYKGEFKNNKKDGVGKLVTNNGLILKDKNLFVDDNLGPHKSSNARSCDNFNNTRPSDSEPWQFDICDSNVGLSYHVHQALKNIDKQQEIITNMVNDYMEANKIEIFEEVTNRSQLIRKQEQAFKEEEVNEPQRIRDLISFEEKSLRKALRCYETDLRNIYYKYATICNTDKINFKPVMIRLYLWQLYNDCNIHEKGLTLYDIDILFYQNREWHARKPHDPFEKIYFWQFLHSLLSVVNKLYAKRSMPGPKPDTILASGVRTFMEDDVIPGSALQKGRLVSGYGAYIPLRATYELYQKLGEPHTIRNYVRAVRRAPHFLNRLQPPIIEALDRNLPLGRNCYIFGDEMSFVVDDKLPEPQKVVTDHLDLFNFANLSNRTIIRIFAQIFPQVMKGEIITDLEIKLTFYEFFEAFVVCAEESIRVKEEELKWREKFASNLPTNVPHSTPVGY